MRLCFKHKDKCVNHNQLNFGNRSMQIGDVFYDNGERKKFQKLVFGNFKLVLSNEVQDIFLS